MNSFENQVCFCTLASLIVICVAVFVINYFSLYRYKDKDGRGTSEELSFFQQCVVCSGLYAATRK